MIEMTNYENIDVDIDPIIVLACGHFYTSTFLDGCMEMEKVYRQDSDGDFTESVSSADMVLSLKNCPECRMPICGIQRYNRIFKCATLNSMLRGIIIRSQESYISIAKNVAKFESQLEKARVEKLRELIPLTNSRVAQPVVARNEVLIAEWLDIFEPISQSVQRYTDEADEKKQPHMKVFESSLAARARREQHSKTNTAGPIVSRPLDVPAPEPKHRILGNILQLRLEFLKLKERMLFAGHLKKLRGGDALASRLSRDTVQKCKEPLENAKKLQQECDKRHYYTLAVEILLLELELIWLQKPSSSTLTLPLQLRAEAKVVLAQCHNYMRQYESCQKYREAIQRGEDMLNSNSTFMEPVSVDERMAVLAAMQMEFRGTGHWYYCRNRHPVSPSGAITNIIKFTIANCGMPMEEARCPECGARIGGQNHAFVEGVARADDLEREIS
jgi:hypothetical protein